MKKNKIICVMALVLVFCFTWVFSVSADSINSITSYQAGLITVRSQNNSTYNDGENWFSCPVMLDGVAYTYYYTSNVNASTSYTNFINIFPQGDLVNLKILVCALGYSSGNINSVSSAYFRGQPVSSYELLTLNQFSISSCVLIFDEDPIEVDCCLYDVSYTSSKIFSNFGFELGSIPINKCYVGFLCELDVYGLSDEEKDLLQQIKIGVDDANAQIDDMQSEQSSYYQDILESEASDTGVIAEASSQKDKFDGVMNEYSSLNEALDRPDVNELLPDYSSLVGGYKDDEFYDVFDVFYGNGYIMFMLLASVFFATMSFVIFGKKA